MDRKREVREAVELDKLNSKTKYMVKVDMDVYKTYCELAQDYLSNKLIEPMGEDELACILYNEIPINYDGSNMMVRNEVSRMIAKALTGKVGVREINKDEILKVIISKAQNSDVYNKSGEKINEIMLLSDFEALADAILSLIKKDPAITNGTVEHFFTCSKALSIEAIEKINKIIEEDRKE